MNDCISISTLNFATGHYEQSALLPYTMRGTKLNEFLRVLYLKKSSVMHKIDAGTFPYMITVPALVINTDKDTYYPQPFTYLASIFADEALLDHYTYSKAFLFSVDETKPDYPQMATSTFHILKNLRYYKALLKDAVAAKKLLYFEVYKSHFHYYTTPNSKQTFFIVSREYMLTATGLDILR